MSFVGAVGVGKSQLHASYMSFVGAVGVGKCQLHASYMSFVGAVGLLGVAYGSFASDLGLFCK